MYLFLTSVKAFLGIVTVNPGVRKIKAKADRMPADSAIVFNHHLAYLLVLYNPSKVYIPLSPLIIYSGLIS